MKAYSPEELNLFAETLDKVLPKGAVFFLVVCEPDKCSAVCTAPPEMASQLKAALAELSRREPRFNN